MNKKYTKPSFFFFVILCISSFFLNIIIFNLYFPDPDVLNLISYFISIYLRVLFFLTSIFISVLIITIFDKKFYKEFFDEYFKSKQDILMNNKVFTFIIYMLSFPFAVSIVYTLIRTIFLQIN